MARSLGNEFLNGAAGAADSLHPPQGGSSEPMQAAPWRVHILDALDHELRNALNGILSAQEVLRLGNGDKASDLQACEIIERQALRAAQLLDESAVIAGSVREPAALPLQLVELPALLYGARAAAAFDDVPSRILIDANGPVRVMGNTTWLRRAFALLMSSCLREASSGTPVVVTVESDPVHACERVLLRPDEATAALRPPHADIPDLAARILALHGGTAAWREGHGRGPSLVVSLPTMAGPTA